MKSTIQQLPGISRDIEAEWINSASEALAILRTGAAVTAAGDNGVLDVYKDDSGQFRCHVVRDNWTLEDRSFEQIEQVLPWVKKWLRKIR